MTLPQPDEPNQRMMQEMQYILAFSPIFLSHILLPPISYFDGYESNLLLEDLYSLFPSITKDFVLSLMLNPSVHTFPKSYQFFSYMCVHGSYAHMLGNLYTAFVLGRPIFYQFSSLGLFFLYLSGGIISSLPSKFSLDNKRYLDEAIHDTFVIRNQAYIPNFAKNLWNKHVPGIGARIVNLAMPKYLCGSSGAVCALLGASIVLSLRDLFNSPYMRQLYPSSSPSPSPASSSVSDARMTDSSSDAHVFDPSGRRLHLSKPPPFLLDPHFLHHVYTLCTSLAYIFSEYSLMYPSKDGFSAHFHSRLAEILELSRVGHVAHFQGTLYGAAFAGTFGVVLPFILRRAAQQRRTFEV